MRIVPETKYTSTCTLHLTANLESLGHFPVKQQQMANRIIQLSDLHLLDQPNELLRGVPTAACLEDIFQRVKGDFGDADQLIFSGDIAAHADAGAYRFVRELWREFLPRCRFIPGNHDDRAVMRHELAGFIESQTGAVTFSLQVANWRLIGLDTLNDGEVAGAMRTEQWDWLRGELNEYRDSPTLLFMHHPPIEVGTPWLDAIMLAEPERFSTLVVSAPQIRGIFCGHVHMEHADRLGDVPVHTSPATAIQFTPGTSEIQFDDVPPGFRVIDLEADRFTTHVVRLPKLKYRAD